MGTKNKVSVNLYKHFGIVRMLLVKTQ